MTPSKENCRAALAAARALAAPADPADAARLAFVKEFLAAAAARLPRADTLARDLVRRRENKRWGNEKRKNRPPVCLSGTARA